MTKTAPGRVLAAAALSAAAFAAQAATVTLSSWTWGNGNAVNATTPAYTGLAGGFSGRLAGAGSLDGSIESYCVELTEHFSFNTAYSDYTAVTATSYFGAVGARDTRLSRLLSYVVDSNVFATAANGRKDDQSTALQLAIWNIVYDSDTTLASGTFRDTSLYSSASLASNGYWGANALLANSAGWTSSLNLYVLRSVGNPGHQDQLIWRTASTDSGSTVTSQVPEPGTVALAGLALAALARRRR